MRVSTPILNENMHPKFIFRTRNCNFLRKFDQIHKILSIFRQYLSIKMATLTKHGYFSKFNPLTNPPGQLFSLIKLKKIDYISKLIAKMGKNSQKLEIDGSKTKEHSCSVNMSKNYHSRLSKMHIYLGVIPENISLIGQKLWI